MQVIRRSQLPSRVVSRRTYATPSGRAPNEQAGNVSGTTSSSKTPLILAGLAGAALGVYWYTSDPAISDKQIHRAEDAASNAYHSAKDRVEDKVDNFNEDRRSLKDTANDTWTSQKNLAGSKADPALGSLLAKGQEVVEDGKSWLGASSSQSLTDKAKTEYEADKAALKSKGEEIKQEVRLSSLTPIDLGTNFGHYLFKGKSWLSWGSSWGSSKVDEKADDLKKGATDTTNDLKRIASDLSNKAQETAEDVKKEVSFLFSNSAKP